MTITNIAAAQNATQVHDELGARCITNAVYALWDRVADTLTPEELQWFSGLSESSQLYLANMEELTDGLGCLISNDVPKFTGGTGAFREPDTAAALMFFLTDALRLARAMHHLGESAQYKLTTK